MNSFTYLLAMKQRCIQQNKPYHIMNNMKYSRLKPELDVDAFAIENDLTVTNDVYNNGAYLFSDENGEIIAVYDYVNQTLFSNIEGF